ncbi:winged helix-turn-helix transcriptional regulator [Clostridium saccharoperbutylacetonicum]|uniref:winged helix-turn-helix transcriptional regulator n=1 Tax=Clostridium saccharoperbutylacetonicum TaxID=36745 RepID=UPI000983C608|nr:helix-turn-helix domain-containing protein [Clostridium saccharoperbutylacetonicum]AQR94828.1 HTH-type transcriptional activator HxlR [Clostridium saccharoperbutylacetonicum]NSB30669.1 DNA-binding HxlR family transcriptional regulator [Clostridium saccharoperbutylacetonicum]
MKESMIFWKENVFCPLAHTLKVIEGKWKLPILWVLSQNGTLRFNELKRSIEGINNMMLTSSLKELENDGLINRIQYNEVPPHVDYSLSEIGEKFLPVLDELAKFSTELMKREL